MSDGLHTGNTVYSSEKQLRELADILPSLMQVIESAKERTSMKDLEKRVAEHMDKQQELGWLTAFNERQQGLIANTLPHPR